MRHINLLKILTVAFVVAIFAANAQAADPNGTWTWTVTTQSGQEFDLAVELKQELKYKKIIADYTRAIELGSSPADVATYRKKLAQAYFSWGDFHFHRDEFDKAFPKLDQAIRLNPEYSEAYDHRGQVYLHKGEPEKAIADLTEAIRLGPAYGGWTYNHRGDAYASLEQWESAVADFRRASELGKYRGSYSLALLRLVGTLCVHPHEPKAA